MTINWQKVVIEPSVSIKEALRVIDKEALRVALVVDNNKLVGMITDGDIRRGILSGMKFSETIEEIYCKTPTTININEFSQKRALKLLKTQKINFKI